MVIGVKYIAIGECIVIIDANTVVLGGIIYVAIKGVLHSTVLILTNKVVFGVNIMLSMGKCNGINTVVYCTNTEICVANTGVFRANTMVLAVNINVFMANTVVFLWKYTGIWFKLQLFFGGKYSGILQFYLQQIQWYFVKIHCYFWSIQWYLG